MVCRVLRHFVFILAIFSFVLIFPEKSVEAGKSSSGSYSKNELQKSYSNRGQDLMQDRTSQDWKIIKKGLSRKKQLNEILKSGSKTVVECIEGYQGPIKNLRCGN